MFRIRVILLFMVIVAWSLHQVYSQTDVVVVPDSKGLYESFFSLKDSTMRAEIGSFSFIGSIVGLSNNVSLREFGVQSQTNYSITLILDDLKIHIVRGPFNQALHRLSYYGPFGYVYKIDGRFFWGFDGRVPNQKLYAVYVYFGQERLELPQSAFRDIYEPNFCTPRRLFRSEQCHTRAFLSEDGNRIYIYMLNSKIPSLYEVSWIINDKRYIGRVVDYAY